MAEKIYTLTEEQLRAFCNTTYVDDDGEDQGILGSVASYGKRRGKGYVERIEIYSHDEITKNYLIDAEVPTSFFALAYDEEGDARWYYPVQAVSNKEYIPVIEEYGYWSWNLISPHVLDHILKTYDHVRISDDGEGLCFKNDRSSNNRNSHDRRPREPRVD